MVRANSSEKRKALNIYPLDFYVGVLHRVEMVPVTSKLTFDTRKYLYGINATAFVALLDEFGLEHYLDNNVTTLTLLAPDNASIDEGSLPDNIKKAWLSYHLVHGQWNRDELEDRQLLASELKTAQLNHKPQQITVYFPETTRVSLYFGNARSHGDSGKQQIGEMTGRERVC